MAPPPPPAQPAVDMGASASVSAPAAPAPTAPPPTAPTAPAVPDAPVKLEDGDGKTIPLIDYLNLAVTNYERTRSSMTEGNIWPPLTSLDQLVQYNVLRKLPPAPEGYKFVFNAETRQVSVAPK